MSKHVNRRKRAAAVRFVQVPIGMPEPRAQSFYLALAAALDLPFPAWETLAPGLRQQLVEMALQPNGHSQTPPEDGGPVNLQVKPVASRNAVTIEMTRAAATLSFPPEGAIALATQLVKAAQFVVDQNKGLLVSPSGSLILPGR